MGDKPANPNIEWKKTGFDSQEKITRKVNTVEAEAYNQKKDNLFKSPRPLPSDLPNGLKKIRKKIRTAFDEDEDEDEMQIVPAADDNSLLSALYDDEKKFLKQQETTNTIKQQLDIEKINTINLAENMARQAGFSGLKKETIQAGMNENSINVKKLNQTIKQEFGSEININKSNMNKLSDKDLLRMMEGVHKVKKIGGEESIQALKKMDAEELTKVGDEHKKKDEKSDIETARTICEKTGRSTPKAQKKKEEKESLEQTMVRNQNANVSFARERDQR